MEIMKFLEEIQRFFEEREKSHRTLAETDRRYSDALKNAMLKLLERPATEKQSAIDSLSPKEKAIFLDIGNGLGVGAIAKRRGLSRKTIETQRDNIRRKMGLKNAAELREFAVKWVSENGG